MCARFFRPIRTKGSVSNVTAASPREKRTVLNLASPSLSNDLAYLAFDDGSYALTHMEGLVLLPMFGFLRAYRIKDLLNGIVRERFKAVRLDYPKFPRRLLNSVKQTVLTSTLTFFF